MSDPLPWIAIAPTLFAMSSDLINKHEPRRNGYATWYVRGPIGGWSGSLSSTSLLDLAMEWECRPLHCIDSAEGQQKTVLSPEAYADLKTWLVHSDASLRKAGEERRRTSRLEIQIKLVDCEQECVVLARTDVNYIALSYVWGQCTQSANTRITDAPLTIRDAIEVTRNRGYRYLWIDRYCIDQSLATEKQEQITSMDTIYANASLTIIDGTGRDSSLGLAGVSLDWTSLPQNTLGEFTMVSLWQSPAKQTCDSYWVSRGWTYQEGVLSPRKIVFLPN